MVLARDVDATGVEVLHGVVGAVMAVRQARRGRSGRAPHDLVTEADAEERDLAEGFVRQLDRAVEHRRVAGAGSSCTGTARSAPCVLMCRVSARVSISVMPGTFQRRRYSSSDASLEW